MERETFICDCHSLEHQVSFWYDEEEKSLYVYPHLTTRRNFFKRLWVGIKYTFGYKSRFGAWDEVIMNEDNQNKLYLLLKDKKMDNGTEYQAERLYNEEEISEIVNDWNKFNDCQDSFNGQDDLSFKQWFEQFKKK